MPLLPIEDLVEEQSEDQVKSTMLSTLATLGLTTTSWVVGGVVRTIVALVAAVAAPYTTVAATVNRGGFRNYATGEFLTHLALSMYNVERIEATAADGELEYTNAAAVPYGPFAAGEFRVAHATTGKTYTNSAALTILASTTAVFDIVADEVGTDSNAAATTISVLENALIGVTVTNDDPLVGTDRETDAALRTRCTAKLGALSPNGPRDAYNYVATTPDLVGGAIVNRVLVTDGANGTVAVRLAGPDGAVTGGDVTLVDTGIQALAVPICITATVLSATELVIPVSYTAWIYADENLTEAEAEALVEEQLTNYFAVIPIGGYRKPSMTGEVYVNAIEGEIRKAANFFEVALTLPAATTAVATTEVPVLGAITHNIVIVAVP
jgi:uncharacterized phage protein gp47/JayE